MFYTPTVKLDPVQKQYQRKYWQVRIISLLIILLLICVWYLDLYQA